MALTWSGLLEGGFITSVRCTHARDRANSAHRSGNRK
jgi:hypothetical protein